MPLRDARRVAMMTKASQSAAPAIGAALLESALSSPLRLRLVAELLDAGECPLSLDEAVARTGRHGADVLACVMPMVGWGVIDASAGGATFWLRADMPAILRGILTRVVAERFEQIERERTITRHVLGGMIGDDPKMQQVFEMVMRVARLDVTVLITGETGTGKELVARAMHEISIARRAHRFGAVNCPTLTDDLFASEMFGHVRGAFTGAVRAHVGLFEQCHEGTLFLDEIGDLTLPNQAKLLRVLQEGTYTRVGDEDARRANVRIVSATNRDLASMVASGTFREDLFYRLNVIPLRLPSLRERLGDIPYLVESLLAGRLREHVLGEEPPSMTPAALTRLRRHSWPGNIRELENVLMRALVMSQGAVIDLQHLEALADPPATSPPAVPPEQEAAAFDRRSLQAVEREHIKQVIRATGGNLLRAASVLEISRTTLYKKIRDYDINVPGPSAPEPR